MTAVSMVHVQMLQLKDEFEAFLAWLKVPPQPKHIIEIGAHQGGTALHFCEIAKGLVISVDLPNGIGGGLPDDICDARDILIGRTFGHTYRPVRGDSHDPQTLAKVTALLAGEQADMLFIDGDHSYAGVKQDYEMYGPLVKTGGHIAFHDINDTPMHHAVGCHVAPFWNELVGEKREFNVHGEWGGIGVLTVTR